VLEPGYDYANDNSIAISQNFASQPHNAAAVDHYDNMGTNYKSSVSMYEQHNYGAKAELYGM